MQIDDYRALSATKARNALNAEEDLDVLRGLLEVDDRVIVQQKIKARIKALEGREEPEPRAEAVQQLDLLLPARPVLDEAGKQQLNALAEAMTQPFDGEPFGLQAEPTSPDLFEDSLAALDAVLLEVPTATVEVPAATEEDPTPTVESGELQAETPTGEPIVPSLQTAVEAAVDTVRARRRRRQDAEDRAFLDKVQADLTKEDRGGVPESGARDFLAQIAAEIDEPTEESEICELPTIDAEDLEEITPLPSEDLAKKKAREGKIARYMAPEGFDVTKTKTCTREGCEHTGLVIEDFGFRWIEVKSAPGGRKLVEQPQCRYCRTKAGAKSRAKRKEAVSTEKEARAKKKSSKRSGKKNHTKRGA